VEGKITVIPKFDLDNYNNLYCALEGNLNDESRYNRIVTSVGNNVSFSTIQSKFGSRSLYIDGTDSNRLEVDNRVGGLKMRQQDYTIHFWWYRTSIIADENCFCEIGDINVGAEKHILFRTSSTGQGIQLYINGTVGYIINSAYTFSLNQWYHIALVRSGGFTTVYVNGLFVASGADTHDINPTTSNAYLFSAVHSTTQVAEGYFSDFVIDRGIGRWNSNFTPPSRYSIEALSISKHGEHIVL